MQITSSIQSWHSNNTKIAFKHQQLVWSKQDNLELGFRNFSLWNYRKGGKQLMISKPNLTELFNHLIIIANTQKSNKPKSFTQSWSLLWNKHIGNMSNTITCSPQISRDNVINKICDIEGRNSRAYVKFFLTWSCYVALFE